MPRLSCGRFNNGVLMGLGLVARLSWCSGLFRIGGLSLRMSCQKATRKSIEFGQNLHKILKKYGNSKSNHLFIQILFSTTDDRLTGRCFMHCVPQEKFSKNEAK